MEGSMWTTERLCSLPLFVLRMSFRNVTLEVRAAASCYCVEGSRQRPSALMSPENKQQNRLDLFSWYSWTQHTNVCISTKAVHKKGQNRLHLLRKLRSFNICTKMSHIIYKSVVESSICVAASVGAEASEQRLKET